MDPRCDQHARHEAKNILIGEVNTTWSSIESALPACRQKFVSPAIADARIPAGIFSAILDRAGSIELADQPTEIGTSTRFALPLAVPVCRWSMLSAPHFLVARPSSSWPGCWRSPKIQWRRPGTSRSCAQWAQWRCGCCRNRATSTWTV